MPETPTTPRDGRGKFVPGASGNPRGRPRGSGPATGVRLRRLVAEHAEGLIGTLIAKAKRGDVNAAIALLEWTERPSERPTPAAANDSNLTNDLLVRVAEISTAQHEAVTIALTHLIEQQRDILTCLEALAKKTTPETDNESL